MHLFRSSCIFFAFVLRRADTQGHLGLSPNLLRIVKPTACPCSSRGINCECWRTWTSGAATHDGTSGIHRVRLFPGPRLGGVNGRVVLGAVSSTVTAWCRSSGGAEMSHRSLMGGAGWNPVLLRFRFGRCTARSRLVRGETPASASCKFTARRALGSSRSAKGPCAGVSRTASRPQEAFPGRVRGSRRDPKAPGHS
jgi:hypothetical protein